MHNWNNRRILRWNTRHSSWWFKRLWLLRSGVTVNFCHCSLAKTSLQFFRLKLSRRMSQEKNNWNKISTLYITAKLIFLRWKYDMTNYYSARKTTLCFWREYAFKNSSFLLHMINKYYTEWTMNYCTLKFDFRRNSSVAGCGQESSN